MTRRAAGFFVFLFSCCVAAAQNTSPAPVRPAAASAESPAVIEFQKIDDAWDNAIEMRDQYALELVLSPLFMDVSAAGDFTTRNQQLALLITGEDKVIHLEQRVITVRMLGDIAVANGTYLLRRKSGGTAAAEEKGVFTHVFERTRGGWVCINSQRTRLPEGASGKAKKPASSAEMPFHIPLLFGKSDKDK
ncbi:MAG: nuclear transport factor 2 family protein [Terracidiphilus sp.]|jgi:ketosteroid isomerase-like protein